MIQPLDEGSETGDGEEDGSDVFTGTLNRNDGYVYTFEGNRKMVPIAALLGSTHTAVEEDRKLEYEGNAYTYIDAGYGMISSQNYNCDPNQQWAVSTEDGDEVIILRYYREFDNPPPGDNEGGDGDKDDDGNGDKMMATIRTMTVTAVRMTIRTMGMTVIRVIMCRKGQLRRMGMIPMLSSCPIPKCRMVL